MSTDETVGKKKRGRPKKVPESALDPAMTLMVDDLLQHPAIKDLDDGPQSPQKELAATILGSSGAGKSSYPVDRVEQLRKLLSLAKQYNVLELEMDGIKIKVDVPATMMQERRVPQNLDDPNEKLNNAKRTVSELLADSLKDELWSS